jgi:large subunit ribosomal protein L4
MAKVKVFKQDGSSAGELTLSDEVFGIEPNEYAVYEAVKNHLANRRQGTQSAKTRSEVRGGGRKPFRQKGTGRARQGSSVAPNHVGGGVVFAPKPRDYRYSLPRKLRRLAMRSILSSKVVENEIIVLPEKDENVIRSAHNIPGVRTALATTINVYEIINHTNFIVTKDAVIKIETMFSKKNKVEEVSSV